MFDEKAIDIITERMFLHVNDPAVNDYWDKLIELLNSDIKKTISFLKNCENKEILLYLSKVFEEIEPGEYYDELIGTINVLNTKYPELKLNDFI